MNYSYIILVAFALAMDAFAVSLAAATYFGKPTKRQKFRLSFHFGLFQFFMPIVGWLLGSRLEQYVNEFDHWIAFVVLAFIGSKMCIDAMNDEQVISKDISKGWSLVSLSLATSIDALAVGFSFGVINANIFIPSIIIGLVAALMSLLGIKLGEVLSVKFGSKAAIVGGIILILIGLNILREHLLQ